MKISKQRKAMIGFGMFWILLLSMCFGAHAQTAWTNCGNGYQTRVVGSIREYRVIMTTGYAPLLLTDSLAKKLNLADSVIKYVTPTQLNTAIAGATIPDATTTVKGKIKLAGDLSGTADLPTVPNKVDKTTTVNGKPLSGNITLNKTDVGLGNVDNTSDATKPISALTQIALDNKVDKVTGKGLSAEDYTTVEKAKLAGIASGAEVNVNADWAANSGDAQILNKPATASNLGIGARTATTLPVTNDNGTGATLPVATTTLAGLQSAADKSKLDGVATGATANQTDAYLLARANQTGVQPISTITDLQTTLDAKIPLAQKAANNGVATLDASGKVPASQLPISGEVFKGEWNASTNVPVLEDGTGVSGNYYLVSVGGTRNLGHGSETYGVGDKVMYNGTIWTRIPNFQSVNSVNGQTGSVVLGKADVGLSNVDNTSDLNKPVSTATTAQLNLKENASNKSSAALGTSTTLFPTQSAVKTYVDNAITANTGASNLAVGTRTSTTLPITNSNGTGFTIPEATTTLLGGMSAADKVKLNGIAAGATANVGTVTSVGLAVPTGMSVVGTPVTGAGTLTLGYAAGYSLPTSASQANWNTAFGWGNHAGLYPTYNGTGATGTWPISVTGSATSAVNQPTGTANVSIANTAFVQTASDLRISKSSTMLGSTSINTIPLSAGSGIWRSEASTDGNYQYQPLLSVAGASDRGWQIQGSAGGLNMQWRSSTATAGVTSYSGWSTIADQAWVTSNFAPITGGGYVLKSGDTMTGQLNGTTASFTGNVSAASTPTTGIHLTNRAYVDQQVGFRVLRSGDVMSGNLSITKSSPEFNLSGSDAIGSIGKIGFQIGGTERAFINANRHTAVGQHTDLEFGTMGSVWMTLKNTGTATFAGTVITPVINSTGADPMLILTKPGVTQWNAMTSGANLVFTNLSATGTPTMTLFNGGVSVTGTIGASGNITSPRFITSGGTTAQYVRGDGTLATFPTIPSGTVTSIASTVAGNALNVPATAITTSGTLAYTWAGTTAQYVNGQGNLTAFPTIPTNTNQLTNGSGFITSSALTPYMPISGGEFTGIVTVKANSPTASIVFDVGGYARALDFIVNSDSTLKKNITPLSNSVEKLGRLKGYSYDWKRNDHHAIGVIAQEVQKEYPEVVIEDDKGILNVDYSKLIAPLIQANNEQQKEIEQLKKDIAELKSLIKK